MSGGDPKPPAIRAVGLKKVFAGSTKALDGLDLEISSGEMVALAGPSGSGKSTLLYALAGLIRLDAGFVELDGKTPAAATEWTKLRSETIGLVFQEALLLPALTVAQNVELPMIGGPFTNAQRRARVAELLEQVGIPLLANRMPEGLSGGEKQRAAIARSLANRPAILLADEPTGELDTANAYRIMDLLSGLNKAFGMTLLVVTHDPRMAACCGRTISVCDGRVIGVSEKVFEK